MTVVLTVDIERGLSSKLSKQIDLFSKVQTSATDAIERLYIVESFYFILIELCISMRIFV